MKTRTVILLLIIMAVSAWAVTDTSRQFNQYRQYIKREVSYIQSINPDIKKESAREIVDVVNEQSVRYSRDPFLYLTIICIESAFDTLAIGQHGEVGLMQILPSTAVKLSSGLISKSQLKEMLKGPRFNIEMGTDFYENMVNESHGDIIQAIMMYNAGYNGKTMNVINSPHAIKIVKEYMKTKSGINVLKEFVL